MVADLDDEGGILLAVMVKFTPFLRQLCLPELVGVTSGWVAAAVIELQPFRYDVRGDTANTPSSVQSQGNTGAVQITAATYRLVQGSFASESRGSMAATGKGRMDVRHVIGLK